MQCIGKGSCWDLHWVFKPRQASMHPVVSYIKFSNKINLCLGGLVRTALWWQQLHRNCTSVGGIVLCG